MAVNKEGTYCFACLDPGEYVLASQAENASGFRITPQAGRDDYFVQNMFMGTFQPVAQQSERAMACRTRAGAAAIWPRPVGRRGLTDPGAPGREAEASRCDSSGSHLTIMIF